MDNVILTAHVASATARFDPARRRRVGLELSLALTGRWPMSCVNPSVLAGQRPQALAAGVDGARPEFLIADRRAQMDDRQTVVSSLARGDWQRWQRVWDPAEPSAIPDPSIKTLDPRFAALVLGNAAVERIAGGCRFTEGPVWFGDGRYLLWSDIPNDRIMKWEEETGAVSVFRKPSNYANGNTRDRQGRLVTCEMDTQRLTRTEYDGTITVLADSFEGKRLTGPNDVVVKSDSSIWFSDNGAGIRGNYLGHKAPAGIAVPGLPARPGERRR